MTVAPSFAMNALVRVKIDLNMGKDKSTAPIDRQVMARDAVRARTNGYLYADTSGTSAACAPSAGRLTNLLLEMTFAHGDTD